MISSSLILRCWLAIALSALLVGGAAAEVLYHTDFDGTAGSSPAGWTVGAGTWTLNGSGRYVSSISSGNAWSRYDGPLADGSVNADLGNYTVVTDFSRTSGTGHAGLFARAADSGETFYSARIFEGNFQLYYFSNGQATAGNPLGNAASGYVNGETWRMSLSVDGTRVTARLFDDDGLMRGEYSVTHASRDSGGAGLRGQNSASFDNFTIKTGSLLAYEGFQASPGGPGEHYNPGASIGGAAKDRPGFSGAWAVAGSGVNFNAQGGAGLTYAGVATTDGALRISGQGNATATRALNYQTQVEDDVWGSFLFSASDFDAGSSLNMTLVGTNGNNLDFAFTSDGANVLLQMTGSEGAVNLGALAGGETHLVLFRAAPSLDGAPDAISVWIDPTNLESLASAAGLGDADATGFAVVRNPGEETGFVLNGFDELSLSAMIASDDFAFVLDEFRLGSGWEILGLSASTMAIPEPSTGGLACGGLLGAVWLVRRRRTSGRR